MHGLHDTNSWFLVALLQPFLYIHLSLNHLRYTTNWALLRGDTHFGLLGSGGFQKKFFFFLNDKVMMIFSGFWKDLSVCSCKSGFGFAIKEEKAS